MTKINENVIEEKEIINLNLKDEKINSQIIELNNTSPFSEVFTNKFCLDDNMEENKQYVRNALNNFNRNIKNEDILDLEETNLNKINSGKKLYNEETSLHRFNSIKLLLHEIVSKHLQDVLENNKIITEEILGQIMKYLQETIKSEMEKLIDWKLSNSNKSNEEVKLLINKFQNEFT